MQRLLLGVGMVGGLLWGGGGVRAGDDPLGAALLEQVILPILKGKVAELDKTTPSEIHYGLAGASVGRNGLRIEVEEGDIVKDGKVVNKKRYNFPGDKFAWAEGGGKWGPPGFQYYVFRHPLALTFDPKAAEFTLTTKLEFKAAVAINFDTGFLGIKPWVFADTGFGDGWPNEVDIAIKSKVALNAGKLSTNTTTHVIPKKPIVLQTLHGIVKRDCSPELVGFLKGEMDKIAAQLDAEAAKAMANLGK